MKSNPLKEDTDSDGIGDEDEICLGLNPMRSDTDNDGICDGVEVQYGFDPFYSDPDYDGKSDLEEFYNGTNPYLYNKEWYDYVNEFLNGFVAGDFIAETDSLPTIMGQITSSMIPLVDIRDVVGNLSNGNYLFAGLSGISLIPVAGDTLGAVAKVGRFAVKNADDVAKVAELMEFLEKNFPDVLKAMNKSDDFAEAVRLISNGEDIKLTRAQFRTIVNAFDDLGMTDYLRKVSKDLPIKKVYSIT